MDSIPGDLLELQARFDQWQANRVYNREPIPDQFPRLLLAGSLLPTDHPSLKPVDKPVSRD
jgi:hypothetical protein